MTRKSINTFTGISILVLLLLISSTIFGQTPATTERAGYTFVYNQVPENYNHPLIGMVNAPEGNQKGFQLGFANINEKSFRGTQVGLTNAIGGEGKGAQIGFVNANKGSFRGAQISYINVTAAAMRGAQVGYVNIAGKHAKAIQAGFVNITKDTLDGVQLGYVNIGAEKIKGAQVGFVNVDRGAIKGGQTGYVNIARGNVSGIQAGFVNVTGGNLRGTQLGFVNIADSASHGTPVGFLSLVRHGGFKVIEAGYSGMAPANLSVKFGVDRFYTFATGSYNPDNKEKFAIGIGFGSIMHLSRSIFFNPEIMNQRTLERHAQKTLTLTTNLGANISRHWSFVAGPTLAWQRKDKGEAVLYKPAFSMYTNDIDARNRLTVGAQAALRFHF